MRAYLKLKNAHCSCPITCSKIFENMLNARVWGCYRFLYPRMFGVVRFLSASNSNDQFVRARYNVFFVCRYKKRLLHIFLQVFHLKLIKDAPKIWKSFGFFVYKAKNTYMYIYFLCIRQKKPTYKCGTSSDKYLHNFRQVLWKLSSLSNLCRTCLDL